MLLIIDNYDSFVYNIIHSINYPDRKIIVLRNDKIKLMDIKKYKIKSIIISPGPMGPREAGMSNEIITTYGKFIPIFGICLGFQCIGYVFKCNVIKYLSPTHGKSSKIILSNSRLFKGLNTVIDAARYHSLFIESYNFNHNELKIIASLEDGTIMGVEHKKYPIFGTQFHPESILTAYNGKKILENFLEISKL